MNATPPRAPLSPARARHCALLNQFATPGLGSLLARRFVAGTGQLIVFLVGFGLFVAWFIDVMRHFYGLMFSSEEVHLRHWMALAGIAIAGLAWLWALATSLSLMREARQESLDSSRPEP